MKNFIVISLAWIIYGCFNIIAMPFVFRKKYDYIMFSVFVKTILLGPLGLICLLEKDRQTKGRTLGEISKIKGEKSI